MIFIEDEGRLSEDEILAFQRMRASMISAGGWIIGERFDDRYDTVVGGFNVVVGQSIDALGQLQGGVSFEKIVHGEYPTERKPSCIVDYGDGGKQISAADAEYMPELAPALARLREREAAYEAFLAKSKQ